MTIDDRYTIIGSYNLGMKSEDASHELAVLIESRQSALQMKELLIKDQANSKEVSFSQALGWYFNPYFMIVETFERKMLDGILM